MPSEIDALRVAKILLDERGAQEAWRILTARALDEHLVGDLKKRLITQQVLSALHKLTDEPKDGLRH